MEKRPNQNMPEVHGNTFRQKYELEGVNVSVNYRILSPKKEQHVSPTPDELIIFLPGWATDAGTKTAEVIGQAFANESNAQTFIVDTKPDKIVSDTLYKEAEAISRLIKQTGAKNVTIAGYSEGGIKAADLAFVLQKDPKITVNGVILMESMGLYDQGSKKGFVGKFIKDTALSSKYLFNRRTAVRGANFGTDVFLGWMRDIARTNFNYRKRAMSQVNGMTVTEKHLKGLQVPIILINAKEGLVSDPQQIIPGYENLKHLEGEEGQRYDPREKLLTDTLFPNAPYVRMIISGKFLRHTMPVLRAEQVVKGSLYLLKRYERTK